MYRLSVMVFFLRDDNSPNSLLVLRYIQTPSRRSISLQRHGCAHVREDLVDEMAVTRANFQARIGDCVDSMTSNEGAWMIGIDRSKEVLI